MDTEASCKYSGYLGVYVHVWIELNIYLTQERNHRPKVTSGTDSYFLFLVTPSIHPGLGIWEWRPQRGLFAKSCLRARQVEKNNENLPDKSF